MKFQINNETVSSVPESSQHVLAQQPKQYKTIAFTDSIMTTGKEVVYNSNAASGNVNRVDGSIRVGGVGCGGVSGGIGSGVDVVKGWDCFGADSCVDADGGVDANRCVGAGSGVGVDGGVGVGICGVIVVLVSVAVVRCL